MNGEDEAARNAARARARSSNQRPLSGDAGFVEGALQALVEWLSSMPSPPAGALSFVRFDYNQDRGAASLGPERRIGSSGPEPGGMHICADPLGLVNVIRTGLMTAAAHVDALNDLELARRAMVIFEPGTRTARILCNGLGWPGAQLRLPQAPVQPWSIADLNQTVEEFHFGSVEGSPLFDLVMEGERLRRSGRAKYHEALYFYLRYERGLDRQTGCEVRLARSVVELRLRGGGREEIKVLGRRSGFPRPQDETAELGRRVTSLAAKHGQPGKPRLHLRCLCCEAGNPCAATIDQAGFTMRHAHLGQ